MKTRFSRIQSFPRRYPRSALVIAIGLLGIGGGLIVWNFPRTAPDPAAISLDDAAGFVRSEAFADLSSQARDDYLKQLAARYFRESAANRALLDKTFVAAGVDRPLRRQIALGMVRSLLSDYDQIDPATRQSRAAALRAFANAMGMTQGTAEALDPAKNPVAKAISSPESFGTWIGRFEKDLLLGLSAEERIKLQSLAHDIRQPRPAAR